MYLWAAALAVGSTVAVFVNTRVGLIVALTIGAAAVLLRDVRARSLDDIAKANTDRSRATARTFFLVGPQYQRSWSRWYAFSLRRWCQGQKDSWLP